MRAWEEFLSLQEKELGKETVEKWLRPLKVVRFDACNLYLEANDSFKTIWFEEHMRHRVRKYLHNNNNKQIKVHLSIANQKTPPAQKKPASPPTSATFKLTFDSLDTESLFETFVTAPNNLLAYKLLKECGESNPLSLNFNPIYLFGRAGTGKTHLLMAAANQLKNRGMKVIYVRADTFTEHVVSAIRSGEMQAFRKTYRTTDALLIDDIEIFSKKRATQEELFHTFNTLHTEGKQIILTADCPPQELKQVAERLISRFEWGIVIPLQMLEKEQMRVALEKKIKKAGFPLQKTVIDFLLETFGGNMKSLIRAVDALMLRSHLNKPVSAVSDRALSPQAAKQFLSDLIQEEERAVLTPGKIIRSVAEHYGIHADDILGKSQSRECALPRQIAMHLCRNQLKLPYMKIGDIFDRDHSTVISSVRQIQQEIEKKNYEISGSVNRILKRLDIP